MKMTDEYLHITEGHGIVGGPFPIASIRISIALYDDSSYDRAGVHLLTDDSAHALMFAGGDSVKECLDRLADRWEQMAKAMRERAAKEPSNG